MIKTKKQMFIVIAVFTLVLLLGTTTYAFFNYTRTGSANTIKTGRIAFNTNQNSTLTLTNVFPISSSDVGNDYTQDTLKIAITGDTTYGNGVEYLVTVEEANVVTSTGTRVPLALKVDVTGNLGTQDTDSDQIDYFTARNAKTTSYYKILSNTVAYTGQYLLVGYIAPGATGVNGTINIKAYLDEDKIAISDTYDASESDNMGTTNEWVDGRVVLTTTEWNNLATSGNELSFKIRVEANEGAWVDSTTTINAAKKMSYSIKSGITEVHFIRLTSDRMQAEYDRATVKEDLTDTTLNEGKVLAWRDGDTLYIASNGETYLPADSSAYFGSFVDVTRIEFENLNTSRVTNMASMFNACYSLTSIDFSGWDMSSVTNMTTMFYGCSSLTSIDLSNKGSNNMTAVTNMFAGCSSLREINMSGFNFGSANMYGMLAGGSISNLQKVDFSNANTSGVTNMGAIFASCSSVKVVDLSGMDTSHVTNMTSMFAGASSLETVYVNNTWSTSSVTSSDAMFGGAISIRGGMDTRYDPDHLDAGYAHIDGGQSNPGYFTQKSN